MGISLPKRGDKVRVILRIDEALDQNHPDFTQRYESYLKTLDESGLPFREDIHPTRMVMERVQDYHAQQSIISQQMGVGKDGKQRMDMAFIMEDVRMSLVDVENHPETRPEDLVKFEKDPDGYASKDLVSSIHAVGCLYDLYAAKQAGMKSPAQLQKK